jgi:broad specificity phosphatase PhoE
MRAIMVATTRSVMEKHPVGRLILIRHADTAAPDTTPSDPGLSKLGVRQAKYLYRRLIRTGETYEVSHFSTSDLARSRQTAELIAPAIEASELTPDATLREMSWGKAEGLSWESMVAEYGQPSGKDRPLAPEGESWNDFENRARLALRRYGQMHGTSVLVCHTGIIEASFLEFAGLGQRSQRFAMAPRNTSITTWVRLTDEDGLRWRLEAYNDSSHLWQKSLFYHKPEVFQSYEPFWNAIEPC